MDALEDALYSAAEYSAVDRKHFVPDKTLETLITPATVMEVLEELNIFSESLQDYIIPASRKVFAILVLLKMVPSIQALARHKFNDSHLPIDCNRDETGCKVVLMSDQNNDAVLNGFREDKKWERIANAKKFYDQQWQFLAPVFRPEMSDLDYTLYECTPLPFTSWDSEPKKGGFSRVYQSLIHPEHQLVLPTETEGKQPSIAVKQMHTKRDYTIERDVLAVVRQIRDDHLIKVVAAFTQGNMFYLLFKWADGGDLKEFWSTSGHSSSKLTETKILWSLRQMKGLVGAIEKLHNFNEGSLNIRHGDIKPQNIVRFKKSDGWGVLQIADMGLGKVHDRPTHLRPTDKGPMSGTDRYKSPEAETLTKNRTSRADDMWSLGCTFLEFVIWLLYGYEECEKFNSSFKESYFVVESIPQPRRSKSLRPDDSMWIKAGSVRLQDAVKDYVDLMYKGDLHEGKGISNALKDLVDFICKELLIEEPWSNPNTVRSQGVTKEGKTEDNILHTGNEAPSEPALENTAPNPNVKPPKNEGGQEVQADQNGLDINVHPPENGPVQESQAAQKAPGINIQRADSVDETQFEEREPVIVPESPNSRLKHRAKAKEFLEELERICKEAEKPGNTYLYRTPSIETGSGHGANEGGLRPSGAAVPHRSKSLGFANTQNVS